METKPYSLQSPEQIAKDYGGNKQKIAEAMQMGIVDPTAGTMAGMFIDRMRSAAQMEQAPQQTVAQQVFTPTASVAPGIGAMPQGGMQPPAPAPAGLGATPEAAMMAEQMPAPAPEMPPQEMPPQEMPPQEMPMMAEGGMVSPYMSGGGLSDLPVPDDMFDEPANGGFDDGYAGGGLVAFANGGSASGGFGDFIEQTVRKLDPNIQIAGRARTPARNAEVGGVAGSYHLIDAARDVSVPSGMSKPQFIAQLKSVFGADYDVLPSKGNSVHVEPGPKLGEKVRAGARPSDAPSIAPQRDVNTVEGQVASVEDIFGRLQQRFGPSEEERASRAKLAARAEELTSDEYQNKMRKDSLWETLATIGFNMASSKSPSLLQAIGEAASAALPGAAADKKERKALKDRGLELMVELGAKDRKEAIPLWNMATEAAKTNMQQQQFTERQKLDVRQVDLAEKRLNEEIKQAGLTKPEDINDRVTRYLLDFPEGTPQHEAAKRVYAARNPSSTTGGLAPKEIVEKGRQGASGFSEGQTAKDTKGRTIVFQGGQWVYP
jgi:hypothetical protein